MDLLVTFLVTAILLVAVALFIIRPRPWLFLQNPNLPPSPFKLPIIGNLHQLGSLPHRSLRSLSHNHGPLMFISLGQVPAVVVSSAAAAEEVLKTHDLAFANRPFSKAAAVLCYGPSNVSFSPYSDRWRLAKKHAVVHLLSHRRVDSFRPIREQAVESLVDGVASAEGAVDLTGLLKRFARQVSSSVAAGRLARGDGRDPNIRGDEEQESALLNGFQVFDVFPSLGWLSGMLGLDGKLEAIRRRRDEQMCGAMEEHRRLPPSDDDDKDFLDVLLSLTREEGSGAASASHDDMLTEDEVKAIVTDMVAAGSDTTYTVIDWAMAELMRNPILMKKAQDEIRSICTNKTRVAEEHLNQAVFLKAVVKETLRLHPPAPLLIPHESTTETVVMGFQIPAKTRVIINAWAIQRDPKSWASDPEEFKPERFLFLDGDVDFRGRDFKFIPFGAGRRMCPGIQLAMVNIHLALANLLYCFGWSLPRALNPHHLDMSEATGITTPRKKKLFLLATPYL